MPAINAAAMTDEALISYDRMMVECVLKIDEVAALAIAVWSDVLRELDHRGFVQLVSGSYDDVGNAIVRRTK